MKNGKLIFLLLLIPLLDGCPTVPVPDGDDLDAPRLTLKVLDSPGSPTFFAPGNNLGTCAKVRDLPANLILSANDSGGVASFSVNIFGGKSLDVIVEPEGTDYEVIRDTESKTETLTFRPDPPFRMVQPSLVVTMHVDEGFDSVIPAVSASAIDESGNRRELSGIDLRKLGVGLAVCP
ncbi:hypothetical protein [Microbulbifer sp. MCCC 1A16149]|uniref:hypothetical protein n=1 Tax=Microbulbifer sp. MCCC 1A16149 TaxID=3411322 RepID=UPI003D096B78